MAKIYRFPKKGSKVVYKIPLYTETEVDIALTCLNVYGSLTEAATINNLGQVDPKILIDSLNESKDSWIFSNDFKTYISDILNNIEIVKT